MWRFDSDSAYTCLRTGRVQHREENGTTQLMGNNNTTCLDQSQAIGWAPVGMTYISPSVPTVRPATRPSHRYTIFDPVSTEHGHGDRIEPQNHTQNGGYLTQYQKTQVEGTWRKLKTHVRYRLSDICEKQPQTSKMKMITYLYWKFYEN